MVAVLAVFSLVSLAAYWPLPSRLGLAMTAAPFGDPLLNAWILAWDAGRMLHGLQGWWHAPFFYPYPDTLAYYQQLTRRTRPRRSGRP